MRCVVFFQILTRTVKHGISCAHTLFFAPYGACTGYFFNMRYQASKSNCNSNFYMRTTRWPNPLVLILLFTLHLSFSIKLGSNLTEEFSFLYQLLYDFLIPFPLLVGKYHFYTSYLFVWNRPWWWYCNGHI